jgi:hypothetical protein
MVRPRLQGGLTDMQAQKRTDESVRFGGLTYSNWRETDVPNRIGPREGHSGFRVKGPQQILENPLATPNVRRLARWNCTKADRFGRQPMPPDPAMPSTPCPPWKRQ